MVGVVGYQTNMGDTDCDCDPSASPNTTSSILPVYPPPVSDPFDQYVQHALCAGNPTRYNIEWEPLTYTASSQTIMTGQDLIDCLTDELNLSSQVIPYYMWHYHGNTSEFGGLYNDWNGRIGIYTYVWQLDGMGMQLIGARDSAPPVGSVSSSGILNATPTAAGAPSLDKGNFQWDMGSASPGPDGVLNPATISEHYPPLDATSTSPIVFSQGLYYYFGVRPAKTSFNIFVRMYINEELADTVI
jgi:hypothetical protein